jgi:Xaa-Pro aminopeptidase
VAGEVERRIELSHDDGLAPAFPPEEYAGRLERIRERMVRDRIDLLYLTAPESLFYLHGYQAYWYQANPPMSWPPVSGTALHASQGRFVHFDQIEEKPLVETTSVSRDNRYFPSEPLDVALPFLVGELERLGWIPGRVGLELWSYRPNPAVSRALEGALRGAGCEVVNASDVLRDVRRVKSLREIACIEQATRIVDTAILELREVLRPGMTELEVYGEMVRSMGRAGGEAPGLAQWVSSRPADGDGLASGHQPSSRRAIERGQIVTLDPCGVYQRYHSNVGRSYFLGDPPRELLERYEKAGGAYAVLRETAKAGTPVADVTRALREYYREVGIWQAEQWAGGYELGISFPPDWVGNFLFNVADEKHPADFEAGMVTNYESLFGTTLIDTVVYEEEGARTLSRIPPELLVV